MLESLFNKLPTVKRLGEQDKDFEKAYSQARQLEGRLYSDQTVSLLPSLPVNAPLFREWQIRKWSANRLVRYLNSPNAEGYLLDLGCGNGWMSHFLARQTNYRIIGLENHHGEIDQAARVFGNHSNLSWVCGDIFDNIFPKESLDVVILASVIQYFPDLRALMEQLFEYLKPGGNIIILDSPFYREGREAKERTRAYYDQLGTPEMARYYHHHAYQEIVDYLPQCLYQPRDLLPRFSRKLGINNSPFAIFRLAK